MNRQEKQSKSGTSKVLKVFSVILLVLIVIGVYVYFSVDGKLKKSKIYVNEEDMNITCSTNGYLNVALFGIDARDTDLDKTGNRSDTIMVISINEKNKKINVVSVYRDTFVYVKDYGNNNEATSDDFTKITHAYTSGPSVAVTALNQNLDLDISKFVTVNFMTLVRVIDKLGGIEIEVPEKENFVYLLNKYGKEVANINNEEYKEVTGTGKQVLNGYQALGYSRVRKGADGRYLEGESDFTRAQRQREVLKKTMDKFKEDGITEFTDILDTVTSNMKTNLSTNELLEILYSVSCYDMEQSIGFPYDKTFANTTSGDSVLAAPSLEENVKKLHSEMFPDITYMPSNILYESSNYISKMYQ